MTPPFFTNQSLFPVFLCWRSIRHVCTKTKASYQGFLHVARCSLLETRVLSMRYYRSVPGAKLSEKFLLRKFLFSHSLSDWMAESHATQQLANSADCSHPLRSVPKKVMNEGLAGIFPNMEKSALRQPTSPRPHTWHTINSHCT